MERDFKKHYGASSVVLAKQWDDLKTTKIKNARVKGVDASAKGLRMFFVAHHFLWSYLDNSEQLASRFGICEKYARGEHLWVWIRRIAALHEEKIKWPKRFDDKDGEIFIISTDGTDCAIWEPKDRLLPQDKKFFTKKKNRAGVKYLVAISVRGTQCVFVDGPFKCGTNDILTFRNKLKSMIPEGKKCIVDGGFPPNPKDKKELDMLALPRPGYGSKEFRQFKARVRCRQESFNKRLKDYSCLANVFRHGMHKHGHAFRAICVTVQYAMENGSPIYDAVHNDSLKPTKKRTHATATKKKTTKKRRTTK